MQRAKASTPFRVAVAAAVEEVTLATPGEPPPQPAVSIDMATAATMDAGRS
jgi:hypothetical protein